MVHRPSEQATGHNSQQPPDKILVASAGGQTRRAAGHQRRERNGAVNTQSVTPNLKAKRLGRNCLSTSYYLTLVLFRCVLRYSGRRMGLYSSEWSQISRTSNDQMYLVI